MNVVRRNVVALATLLFAGMLLLLSSCGKEKFRLFDDLDCITPREVVHIEVPLTEIPGRGGYIKVTPNVYTETTYFKGAVSVDTKQEPITDYTVQLVDAPRNVELHRTNDGFVLQVPENRHFDHLPITVEITAKGITKKFTFIQHRLTVKVDVELV